MLQNPELHYLDNAATTMVAPEVADVIDKAMREHWANPSSLYGPGARSEEALPSRPGLAVHFAHFAAQDLPILRPLIGMDKTEIVETARHINTFETSILPYEDCCTIFTPPHPKIRPELAEILEAEAAMPGLAALEAEAAESAERIRIRITDQVEFEG